MKLDRFQQFVEKMNEASTAAATAAITMQKNLKDLSPTSHRRKKDQGMQDKTRQDNKQRLIGDEEMEGQIGDEEMEGQVQEEEEGL